MSQPEQQIIKKPFTQENPTWSEFPFDVLFWLAWYFFAKWRLAQKSLVSNLTAENLSKMWCLTFLPQEAQCGKFSEYFLSDWGSHRTSGLPFWINISFYNMDLDVWKKGRKGWSESVVIRKWLLWFFYSQILSLLYHFSDYKNHA